MRDPIFLDVHGKSLIPAEVSLCSAQVKEFTPAQNDGLMMECLDLLEE